MKLSFIKFTFLLFSCVIFAQEGQKQYHFKRGEVLDVLLLTGTTTNFNQLFNTYKKTAIPIALKYSFQSQPSFKIKALTLGNHLPSSFIFGKWDNIKKRKEFIQAIEKDLPSFHKQRRALFTYFGLVYFEIDKELQFSIQKDKVNIVTSFWRKKGDDSDFYASWETSVTDSGGKVVVTLENGESPLGYVYKPDIISIIEWETKEQFESFTKNHPLSSYDRLSNVHQFQID